VYYLAEKSDARPLVSASRYFSRREDPKRVFPDPAAKTTLPMAEAGPAPVADEEVFAGITHDEVTTTLGVDVAAAIASLADGVRASGRTRAERDALEGIARQIGVEAFCAQRLKVIACIMGPNAAGAAASTAKEKDEARRQRKNQYMNASSEVRRCMRNISSVPPTHARP